MDTAHNIKLADAYTEVTELFGVDRAKALNRLTILTVESGHEQLVTSYHLQSELALTASTLRHEMHEMI